MNYETMKSFILVILVGTSFLLSFILWSYQPNYDYLYDASYVNEVDVGGDEKTKNELIEPNEIIFRNEDHIMGFKDPQQTRSLYKEIASWVMYDFTLSQSHGRPNDDQYVEMIFPHIIPAELMMNLFTFHETIEAPDWSFDRVFMKLDDKNQSIQVIILSMDERRQITARIDKSESYHILSDYLKKENNELRENIMLATEQHPIYIPKDEIDASRKTVIATTIDPEEFINALFSKPSLVTRNNREAYFTDGQRGMRIVQNHLRLEYINPIQSNYHRLPATELIDKSINHINEHKGWTNSFSFDGINRFNNNIRYRLTYNGYPVFDYNQLSMIEQEWRAQDLYKYSRPLVQLSNVLNDEKVILPSGKEVVQVLEANEHTFNLADIKNIQIGYYLNYLDDAHSLTLEPSWFIVYENDWMRLKVEDYRQEKERGED